LTVFDARNSLSSLTDSIAFRPLHFPAPCLARSRSRQGGFLFEAKPSVLKCHADKIALPPDHAAPADGVKIIECQFKARRQDVRVSQLDSRAAIGNIPNPASEYAALRIEKYQRTLRDRRSADGSSFNHRSPPVKLKPRIG
jgi:hypothetical protein